MPSGWPQALVDVKDKLGICAVCNNISDGELCNLLPRSASRSFRDLRGRGAAQRPADRDHAPVRRACITCCTASISPLRGIGPEQLRITSLLERMQSAKCKELIVATNPTVEGEATAVYLSRLMKPLGVKVTRIAMGIPVGSDLEFADEVTMGKSLENRREM